MNPIDLIKKMRRTFELSGTSKADKVLALKLINEEVDELTKAVYMKDNTEIQDALGDILFVLVQAFEAFDFDIDKTVKAIYESNMTKLCSDKYIMEATLDKYHEMGIEVFAESLDNGMWIVKRSSDKKFLKSINFTPPIFKSEI